MLDFTVLAQQCAPTVHPVTMQAVVRTESGFYPYAIGVVGGHLERQPRDLNEAVATARALTARGINFSVGIGQVNRFNLARYGLTYDTAFDPCANLQAGSAILRDCYERAAASMGKGTKALRAAISCYYSGNFTRGLLADSRGSSYVQRVVTNAQQGDGQINVVPAIPVTMNHAPDARASVRAVSGRVTVPRRTVGSNGMRDGLHPTWDAFGEYSCDGQSCE
ncbi:transglycosylase SLT domain-containing protein [Paraburkholderia sp. CNPSo 3157]|uniref:Transglycosylase SLT domain-containing protein n=1 Tax=Paraburkholderia franconis TaxID=2654983 RepID=A0A7X1TI63_9BURK|nr:lytic transglycosylase domain-containing protein [Paraburkholderia franconis]MPW20066.1 transglycosylase SLT domain-containing protein [Paraburkholderia franconis]